MFCVLGGGGVVTGGDSKECGSGVSCFLFAGQEANLEVSLDVKELASKSGTA